MRPGTSTQAERAPRRKRQSGKNGGGARRRPGAFASGVEGRHIRVQPHPGWGKQLMHRGVRTGTCEKGHAMGQDLDGAESNCANRGGAAAAAGFA
jgi:hypothetical protein